MIPPRIYDRYISLRRRAGRLLYFAAAGLLVSVLFGGCRPEHFQSSLHPSSGEAAEIARLWWFMFWVLAGVFVVVIFLTLWAVLRRKLDRPAPPGGAKRFILLAGIILPSVVLVVLLFYSLTVTSFLRGRDRGPVIQVTAHQWWWDVRYPEFEIVTANEIYIPAGEPVRIELRSNDVVHSFWVPNLHGKLDMTPGVLTQLSLNADEPGVWRGQCAEFCGRQHAQMAFKVVALSPDEFKEWVQERQPAPADAVEASGEEPLARGRDVFFSASCNECHTIRGTEAKGFVGPDLTHIGSRLTLGAGVMDNDIGNLMGWIVNPQEIKPGNLMPKTYLEPDELRALAEYLQSLE